jgi:hypothetical protein
MQIAARHIALLAVATACSGSAAGTTRSHSPASQVRSSGSPALVTGDICDKYPPAPDYEGLSESDAVAKGAPDGVRVLERDRAWQAMLKNLDANRVSIIVENGIVSHACRF